jgi:transcription initiation factor TFIID subunit 5
MFYPIFVHTYLQLVSLGAASVAHALLAESKNSILASSISPRQRKSRGSELYDLLSISTPEQLETSNLAKAFRAQRTPIRLSKYGYDLVLQYLRQADMLLMLSVINQWLAVEIVAEAVAPAALDESGLLASVGGDGGDAGTINQTELNLKLLKTSAEHVYQTEILKIASDAATKSAEDENVTKKEKIARQKAATEAKQRLDEVAEKFTEATIPLPTLDKQVQETFLEHLKASESAGAGGKPVSADALPSAAFLTFINAQQTLNSISLSSAGNSVVAGFADSSVRIYNLDNNSGSTPSPSPSPSPTILRGHSGPVYATNYSPDDQLLLSSSADGTARLWSTKLSVGLVAYQGHMLPVWDVAFAPDYGYYFATASADRTARIWVTERTQPLRVFAGHQSDVDVVKWHPNCHYIVTGSSDRSVRVWDLRSGGCVRMLLGHNAPITALSISHDGATIASADANGALSTWDLASARKVGNVTSAHDGPIWSLDYSYGEGKVLASGGSDFRVKLWSSSGSADALGCVATWSTKATPVIATSFTKRNLLLAAGPLSLSKP